MSKGQTRINFVEKKKTSARLEQNFKNELQLSCKSIESLTDINPKISIKTAKENLEKNEIKYLLRSSPVKKEVFSFQSNENSNNFQEISEYQTLSKYSPTKGFRNVGSPKKNLSMQENVEPKKSPTKISMNMKDAFQPLLRSSPRKREAMSSIETSSAPYDQGCSPPKRDCSLNTPSQSIANLSLESPDKQSLHSRKELFPRGKFDEACKALHSSAPTKLPGREDKLDYIKDYLKKHQEEQTSGTLYISGPPGTGKTATINLALEDQEIAQAYQIICLNCTTLNSCGSIYNRIVKELKLKVTGHSEKTCLAAIEKYLESSKRKMILIVLDELDQLCTKKQSVLYSVFEWPAKEGSRLVLVGIANALDLTDRVLPRLQARLALQPTILHFISYTRQQIIDIIADRLRQAGVEEVFSGPTLQLLAGKVAAVNGDVRRALDIARTVVEVAETRSVLKPLLDNGTIRQTVAIQEVMTVVNDVYNTAQSLDSSQSSSFPLQQKLLICSLLLIRQTSKAKDVTLGKLHEVYKKVCERRNLSSVDLSEFISLSSLVEARGILRVTGKTKNRLSKVVLQWDENEVKSALQDKNLLAAVLMDKSVTTTT